MKKINQYIEQVVMNLSLSETEKDELKEELHQHFTDHIRDLLVKGYSEKEAIELAIQAFGDQHQLNSQLKRVYFPYDKVFRYVWSVAWTSLSLTATSYGVMEYYHPEFDNTAPFSSIFAGMFIVAIIALVAESIFEAIQDNTRWTWVKNPWFFFGIPALLIGSSMSIQLFGNTELYPEWLWIDQLVVPIATLPYLVSRQLFDRLFTLSRSTRGSKR